MDSNNVIIFENDIDYTVVAKKIKNIWNIKHSQDGIFKYKLNVEKQKVLEGFYGFLLQLNKDRTTKRRPPQIIESITSPFDPNCFNFTKVDPKEVVLHLQSPKFGKISILINNSPLTPYHSLICPRLDDCLPQKLTKDGLEFCIELLFGLDDAAFRIGYNSPGALASVNHFHTHLFYVNHRLHAENMELVPLSNGFYKIHNKNVKLNVQGFCFRIANTNETSSTAINAYKIVDYLCNQNIAHNIFLSYENKSDKFIRLYIWPRENLRYLKTVAPFNVAFCEISGYVPVGNEALYESITEDELISKINAELGTVNMEELEKCIKKLLL